MSCPNFIKDFDIEVTKDGFILYDEEKVYHRDMTAYELEQINNTEKTPAKSELSFSGFEELNSIFDDAVLSEYMKKTYSDSEDYLKPQNTQRFPRDSWLLQP